MAVSEEDLNEDDIIREDFKKAREIYERITKELNITITSDHEILFTLCLIYVRQLKHHKYEERDEK